MISEILRFAVISGVVYLGIALGLILSQRPGVPEAREGLDFSGILQMGPFTPPASQAFTRKSFTARDGATLDYTHVKAEGADALPLVIMIHGSGWYGGQFDRLAWALRDVAEVKALTLRGHGSRPARRGDVDYIGQLEDDLADLVATDPRKPVLLGHSSGGGLAVRFAGGPHGETLGGAILLAPFLRHDAPTTRRNSGGWAHVLTRRVIGLAMLNAVGIHWLDRLTMIGFSMPRTVLDGPLGGFATTSYTWRLNTSYAPRRAFLQDVARLPPFLLIVGARDEAMAAAEYAPLMGAVTARGHYSIVEGAGHLEIVDHPETERLIRDYLNRH